MLTSSVGCLVGFERHADHCVKKGLEEDRPFAKPTHQFVWEIIDAENRPSGNGKRRTDVRGASEVARPTRWQSWKVRWLGGGGARQSDSQRAPCVDRRHSHHPSLSPHPTLTVSGRGGEPPSHAYNSKATS